MPHHSDLSHFKNLFLTHHERTPLRVLNKQMLETFSETVSACDNALEKAFKMGSQKQFNKQIRGIKNKLDSLANSLTVHYGEKFHRSDTPKNNYTRRLIVLLGAEIQARKNQIDAIIEGSHLISFANERHNWSYVHDYLNLVDEFHSIFYDNGKINAKKFIRAKEQKNQLLSDFKDVINDIKLEYKRNKFLVDDIDARFKKIQKNRLIQKQRMTYNSLAKYYLALFEEYRAYYGQISAYWEYLNDIVRSQKIILSHRN